jgi:Pyridoxamine 5'-phosphate oxidase
MARSDPVTDLDPEYSSEDAPPTQWADARLQLQEAQTYWISTVRPDGRPHITTLLSVWMDEALYITTGPQERKAKNLAQNAHCILMTGCNVEEGLDVMVEGDAVRLTDNAKLQRVADTYEAKYGGFWHFDVREGAFYQAERGDSPAWVFEIAPSTAFGFQKGEVFSQTRWRFA